MIRYICNSGARLIRSQIPIRGMSVETMKDVDEIEREKKLKMLELELDVNKSKFH
jgi:hypothetical protein